VTSSNERVDAQASAAAEPSAVVPSRQAGRALAISWRRAPISARAVSPRKGWASRTGCRADRRQLGGVARRQEGPADAQRVEQRRNWSSTTSASVPTTSSDRASRPASGSSAPARQAGVFALGEGGLDAAAAVVEMRTSGAWRWRQALGGREIELDDLRRAGADQEQV
jgi:hypothetical protein